MKNNGFELWEMVVNRTKWPKEYIPTKEWVMNWTNDNSLRDLYNQKKNDTTNCKED